MPKASRSSPEAGQLNYPITEANVAVSPEAFNNALKECFMPQRKT